jgi:hypothetical protein
VLVEAEDIMGELGWLLMGRLDMDSKESFLLKSIGFACFMLKVKL